MKNIQTYIAHLIGTTQEYQCFKTYPSINIFFNLYKLVVSMLLI